LIELRILERVAPVTDSPRRTCHSSYRIADVAVGPFWTSGKDSVAIDAVVLAGRSRAAVLVGEAKWTRVVNGESIRRDLEKKLAHLQKVATVAGKPLYAVCAREKVTPTRGVRAITARHIFLR